MEDLFQVGVITAPHGVRGEVKVFPTTDDNARFKNLKTVLLDQGRGTRELEIEGVKFFKNMVILKFKGIDDRNDVERMRQAKLLVTRENAVELGKDEYFIADLIGIQVVSDEGEELGTISDVLHMDWIRMGFPPPMTRSPIRIVFVWFRYMSLSPFCISVRTASSHR